jgi:MFS family permease
VHRTQAGTGNPFRYLPELLRRPILRRVLVIDFVYWFAFAIFQTTFALFAAIRFGFDAPRTGYFFAAFGVLGAVVQGGFIRPVVARLGDRTTFMLGLAIAVIGLVSASLTHSVSMFALTLVPVALGMGLGHPTVSSIVSRAARGDEQGRVQGAASAVESLGRTLGPVAISAAVFLIVTLLLTSVIRCPETGHRAGIPHCVTSAQCNTKTRRRTSAKCLVRRQADTTPLEML